MIDNIYAIAALLLLVGLPLGFLAKFIRLPSITGYILGGLLLGPILHLVNTTSPRVEAQLEPMTNLALSLIAVTIGSHLKFRMLRNAKKRIFAIGAVGTIVVPLVVALAILTTMGFGSYPGADIWYTALFMGILAVATAPATVVHVVKESQARGVFVKTLIAVVVFNNVTNILLFEGAKHYVFGMGLDEHPLAISIQLGGSMVLGSLVAFLLVASWSKLQSRQRTLTLSFAALIVAYGLALHLGLSPVLTSLSLGITIANLPGRNKMLDLFEDYEVIIYALFFTLMGTHANFAEIGSVGILAGVYFLFRTLANLGTIYVSGRLTHMPKRVSSYLGMALIPQAGITVGLVVSLEAMDRSGMISGYLTPAVMLAVAVSEIVGPIILRFALRRSGEVGEALPRLVDFLQEEYITLDVKSRDREGVIRELVDYLYKTHPSIRKISKKQFSDAVVAREMQASTGVGMGVAIPHGPLEGGRKIVGVMGVIRDGLDWDSPDKKPTHMVILVATPPNHEEQHLGVLATISQLFRHESVTDRGLHLAKNATEVYEVLADEEFQSLNQVLESELGTGAKAAQAAEQAS